MIHEFNSRPRKGGQFFYFEIQVGPNPQSLETHMKNVFALMGLRTPSAIEAFDKFMGEKFFKNKIIDAGNNPKIVQAVTNPQGKITIITVQIYPAVVEKLKRFGINLAANRQGQATFNGYSSNYNNNVNRFKRLLPVPETPVSKWTDFQKVDAVIKRAVFLLPADVGKELYALLDPAALAIVVGVVVIWAGSHFFGIGEIIDVILLVVGVLTLGPIIWEAGKHLIECATKTINAQNDKDLDEAAEHLSKAVSMLGVQIVMALLLKKAPKVLREPRVLMDAPTRPFTIKTIGEPPVTKGKWFYELPEINVVEHPYSGKNVGGVTDQWGRSSVVVGKNASELEIQIAKFHEEFHRLLAPRFQLFPKLRQTSAVLKTNSYLKSYLLRYIEEALAETTAQLRAKGFSWQQILEGFKYPVGEEGYVTVVKMKTEAKGILLGPVNVGGMLFNVYYSTTQEW